MKFSALPLLALTACIAVTLAAPAPEATTDVSFEAFDAAAGVPSPTVMAETHVLEKRAPVIATVKGDGVRYRKCPRTNCAAIGQYAKGTKVKIDCYTRDGTTEVHGDKGWGKIHGSNYWISMYYLSWPGQIFYCPK